MCVAWKKKIARRELFEISLTRPVELCVLHYTAAFDSYRTTISFSIMQYIAFFARREVSAPRRTPFWHAPGEYGTGTLLGGKKKRSLCIIAGDYINGNVRAICLAEKVFEIFFNDEIGETDRTSKKTISWNQRPVVKTAAISRGIEFIYIFCIDLNCVRYRKKIYVKRYNARAL